MESNWKSLVAWCVFSCIDSTSISEKPEKYNRLHLFLIFTFCYFQTKSLALGDQRACPPFPLIILSGLKWSTYPLYDVEIRWCFVLKKNLSFQTWYCLVIKLKDTQWIKITWNWNWSRKFSFLIMNKSNDANYLKGPRKWNWSRKFSFLIMNKINDANDFKGPPKP